MLGLLVHGVHLLLVVLGLVGVAVLLLPQAQATLTRRTSYRPPSSPTEHDERIAALRAAVQEGRLTAPAGATGGTSSADDRDSSLWRVLAVSSSVAAAGVHAAVFPHHLEEAFVVGAFFLVVTLAQAAWACLVCLEATNERLMAGIVGSLGLVALWAVSRTVGIPGLGREAVGGWDLAAGAWELIVVAACVVGLTRRPSERARVLGDLGRTAWLWVAFSGAVLVALTLTVSQQH